jgi:hypothetical protein
VETGTTLVVVKSQGFFKEGMTFTCVGIKEDYAYLWSHDQTFSTYEIKVNLGVIKNIMRKQDYRIIGFK